MGHDTHGYTYEIDEIAYLRRAMGMEDSKVIYNLLGMDHAYSGCSGDGSAWFIDVDTVEEALEKAKEKKVAKDILEFLMDLHKAADESKEKEVLVRFG